MNPLTIFKKSRLIAIVIAAILTCVMFLSPACDPPRVKPTETSQHEGGGGDGGGGGGGGGGEGGDI